MNDIITIKGTVKSHNGTLQISGGSYEITGKHEQCSYGEGVVTEPTCTAKGYTTYTCTVCSATNETDETEMVAHNYIDGACTACGAKEGVVDKVYSYEFSLTSATYTAAGEKTLNLNDVDWTFAGEGAGYFGYDSNKVKGQQFGSGTNPFTSMTLTSADFTNVKKVVVTTCGAKSIVGTLTVTVGGTQIGETITLTKDATEYTFELPIGAEPLNGPVVLNYAQTSSKAIYISSIEVTYQ